jgi:hypothetical protein
MKFPPEAAMKLYDKCLVSNTDYLPGTEVPPHHKRSVVLELLTAIAQLDPSIDPNS